MSPPEDYAGLVILGRMRFASEPGVSTRKIPRVCAAPVDSMRHPIRPQNGPSWGVSEAYLAPQNAKKRPSKRSVTKRHQVRLCAHGNATHETTHPRHPRHPGDIGDIGDISRKPLKMQDFLRAPSGDILGDIFGDGDFRAQDTPCVCAAPVDSIRCGEPLPRKAGAPSVFRRPAPRPGSTCEG